MINFSIYFGYVLYQNLIKFLWLDIKIDVDLQLGDVMVFRHGLP